MSTEIKNTLFKFVTMRAPELIHEDKIEKSFVAYPDLTVGVDPIHNVFFEAATNIAIGKTKAKSLTDAAATFALSAIKKREDLYTTTGPVYKANYDFAVWLTANRNSITAEKLSQYNGGSIPMGVLRESNESLNQLWENLFYQIITYKSGEVRDAILSILVANNFLNILADYPTPTDELVKELALARVIIPKELFEKEDTSAKKEMLKIFTKSLRIKTEKLDKQLYSVLGKDKIKYFRDVIAQLKKAKSTYNKNYKLELDNAKKTYEEDIEEAYSNATKEIKAYTETDTGVERSYIEYSDLEVPKFEFEKPAELTSTAASDKINADNLDAIMVIAEENTLETFDELIAYYDNQIAIATTIISETTPAVEEVFSSGGIVLPQENTTSEVNFFTIGAVHTNNPDPLTLVFGDSFQDANIVWAKYRVLYDDDTEVNGVDYTQSIENNKLCVKIYNEGLDLTDRPELNIRGSLTLDNGRQINFEGNAWKKSEKFKVGENTISDGQVTYIIKGNGTYKNVPMKDLFNPIDYEQFANQSEDGSVIDYIPSGFGVKRTGIADYRKVEQEICCYVPGEVSHIENVMASEYKEKSTRRLRRSENTLTTSSEKESEKLTDTTSTDRFEMNQEVNSILSAQTSYGMHGQQNWSNQQAGISGSVGSEFAYNTSSEESDLQAVTHAKDISERVLDRVVQKIKEERVSKIIEEFEENSKHGFDNRKNANHVSGVYRWVDKIYRNKIVNYGKRLMYEFMIPQPASFHSQATTLKKTDPGMEVLLKPVDPRTAKGEFELTNYKKVNADNSNYWASALNVEIESMPAEIIYAGKSIAIEKTGTTHESATKTDIIKIDERYYAKRAKALVGGHEDTDGSQPHGIAVLFGDKYISSSGRLRGILNPYQVYEDIANYRNEVPVSVYYYNYHVGNVNISVECALTDEARNQWKSQTFNAIISAYEEKLAEYNAKLAEQKAMVEQKVKTNPLFFRQIENTVLRKNCIEYMLSHNKLGYTSFLTGNSLQDIHALYDEKELEKYAAKVKFFEQAFEWNLMSYMFYPFYWGERKNWAELYNVSETDDPTFRAFLQSGMARIIVTVRPGFEEAVNWYMATGQVWNGGQVPTMDDPMFLSIVEELRETEGEVEETWESRVPTSLTIIQAGSIGLEVEQALPCDEDCADYKLFDSDGQPVLDENGKQVSTNPLKMYSNVTLKGLDNSEDQEGDDEGTSIIPEPGDENPPVES
ncbi:hypothetical protein NAT51_01570 [Flavobacterium amniphilum]|uniref:hypothetical protein n=1 Tax=Flavobacterium amniphilum TaxID=1834035 RepID=UPI00202A6E1A|nr:hypothetical protein [Flavobacterium amniphilum]MCL9804195.1 hypothetical protein [Flavobacterium amniphilum]